MFYDVVIIGSGPAGLAAAHGFQGSSLRVAVIDRGADIASRDKTIESELTQGDGGAGLYSDGKFSFYPSATSLWELPEKEELKNAYEWTCNILNHYGLDTPPYPQNKDDYTVGSGEWILKEYPSDYLSLEKRISLVHELVKNSEADFFNETNLVNFEYNKEEGIFNLNVERQSGGSLIQCRRLVVTGGRFGGFLLKDYPGVFHRLEVGFRIEQSSEQAFFRNMPQLDPKMKMRSNCNTVEWRTFCACREGDTVLTKTLGLWTVSGHSDGPATGRSNVGFNTRVMDQELAKRSLDKVIRTLSDKNSYFKINLGDAKKPSSESRKALEDVYGEELVNKMIEGVESLSERFPEINDSETTLIGPTLEGVGWYPKLEQNLKTPEQPIYVAGDACGLFRGIVAAMISGNYVSKNISKELSSQQVESALS